MSAPQAPRVGLVGARRVQSMLDDLLHAYREARAA